MCGVPDMDNPVSIANIVTILVFDRVVSLAFMYLLVRLLTGGKPIIERRNPEMGEVRVPQREEQ